MADEVELLVTVVVKADNERWAHHACSELVGLVCGRIVDTGDCSAEEPGCWSVTIGVASDERANHNIAAALARAVRRFVRGLGTGFTLPRVACEPPTAWTVLDDPELVGELVPGGERILVEAWSGHPYAVAAYHLDDPDEHADQDDPPTEQATHRLLLRVQVVAERPAGARWQARAVASRISRDAEIVDVTEAAGVLTVHVDLGAVPDAPEDSVLAAVQALDRTGWSAVRRSGGTATASWQAAPRPAVGVAALELLAGPAPARVPEPS